MGTAPRPAAPLVKGSHCGRGPPSDCLWQWLLRKRFHLFLTVLQCQIFFFCHTKPTCSDTYKRIDASTLHRDRRFACGQTPASPLRLRSDTGIAASPAVRHLDRRFACGQTSRASPSNASAPGPGNGSLTPPARHRRNLMADAGQGLPSDWQTLNNRIEFPLQNHRISAENTRTIRTSSFQLLSSHRGPVLNCSTKTAGRLGLFFTLLLNGEDVCQEASSSHL